jgi:ubiquinone/menaquinone biosynthesis C-methylase UbiE
MFSSPENNIAKLGLKEGMLVADFGAGTGFNTKVASVRVGHTGKVYAIEIQKGLVNKLRSELAKEGISNVEVIWGDIEVKHGTKIANNLMDAVIASNILFQAEDKLGFVDEIKRILKPQGKVLVIDWNDSFSGMGPIPEHIIKKDKAEDLFIKRGFKKMENISVGDHHYGIIFKYEG